MIRTLLLFLAAASTALASGPAWDSSGNGMLNGTYNFRQVQYTSDGSGNISQEIAYFGNISFNGAGSYTLSGSNTLVDTGGTLGIPSTGTYSVAASAYGFLSNPIAADASVYFLVANQILIGSSTESGGSTGTYINDLFIATPATPTFTNASFNGSYALASFLPGVDAAYTLNPDGAGHLGVVNKTFYVATGMLTGSYPGGSSYAFANGVGTTSIGTNAVANGVLISYGQENLYMSPDSNFVFGGSPTGYDMYVGVRVPASGTPGLTPGLYYEIGMDEDESQLSSEGTAGIDSYYGVFNAVATSPAGVNVIGHERLLYAGSAAESFTYAAGFPGSSSTGSADVGQLDPSATVQYAVGSGGIRVGFGIGPWLGLEIAFPAAAPTPSGAAFIDPTGVVNTASSAPFTAGISPGEFITLYNGVGLANSSTCWTAGPPFPTTLGGIQVMIDNGIDNIAAPIYCVGSQITVIVPYEVNASPIASIQVLNGTVSSNIVTAYVYKTTPGVFTFNPVGGDGYAAAEHGDYSLITSNNPAQPGETIAVYLSGLGSVFPLNGVPVVDGAAAGPNGQPIVSNVEVDVGGFGSTSVPYTGLTPGTAGLYQINFQVPYSAPAGNDVLAIVGPGSYSAQALLPVGSGAAARPSPLLVGATSNRQRGLPRLNNPERKGEPSGRETQ